MYIIQQPITVIKKKIRIETVTISRMNAFSISIVVLYLSQLAMADFQEESINVIHCNKCYELFAHAHQQREFVLTECGHILCSSCIDADLSTGNPLASHHLTIDSVECVLLTIQQRHLLRSAVRSAEFLVLSFDWMTKLV